MAQPDVGLGPLSRGLPAALLGVLLLTGCTAEQERPSVSEGTSVAEPGPSCSPPPAVVPALPSTFPLAVGLPPGAVLTAVGEAGGVQYATGRAQADVAAVLAHFRTALPAAGAFVGRDEDEGRGGELTFLGGSVEGGVTVAKQSCPEGATAFTVSARRTR